MNNILFFDFETTSKCDLKSCGAYVYSKHPTTDILCMSIIQGKTKYTWYPGDSIEFDFNNCILIGHNIVFDLLIYNNVFIPKYGKKARLKKLRINDHIDTMSLSYYKGYPGALEKVSKLLSLNQLKFAEGRRAMLELSRLGKEAKNYNEKLFLVGSYCLGDVEITKKIYKKLGHFDNVFENKIYQLTNDINMRGIGVDTKKVDLLIKVIEKIDTGSDKIIQKLSNGILKREDLNRTEYFKNFLKASGVDVPNVQRATLENIITTDIPKNIKDLINLRIKLSFASVRKLSALKYTSQVDGRSHGSIQYHGAHTGRWAGRGIQPQNFPRDTFTIKEFDLFFEQVNFYLNKKTTSMKDLKLIDDMPKAMRKLIISGPGKKLVIADYAQIEARVLAWLAGEASLVKTFIEGKDIYCDFASKLYNKEITKNEHPKERQIGKAACLGLGYGMGHERFRDTVKKQTGITMTDTQSQSVVNKYRFMYGKIPRLWAYLQSCFSHVFKNRKKPLTVRFEYAQVDMSFSWNKQINGVKILLPSNRSLYYPNTELKEEGFKWLEGKLYGGLLCENIIQALSRDIMSTCMIKNPAGIIMTIHDEIVWEIAEGKAKAEVFEKKIKSSCPTWFNKKLIETEIEVSKRYGK